MSNISGVLIKLVINVGVFATIADSLLTYDKCKIEFKSMSIRSYSNEHELAEIKEQVAGYLAKVQIEVRTTQEEYADILAYLKEHHPKVACDYMVIPVIDFGVF